MYIIFINGPPHGRKKEIYKERIKKPARSSTRQKLTGGAKRDKRTAEQEVVPTLGGIRRNTLRV